MTKAKTKPLYRGLEYERRGVDDSGAAPDAEVDDAVEAVAEVADEVPVQEETTTTPIPDAPPPAPVTSPATAVTYKGKGGSYRAIGGDLKVPVSD